MSEFDLQFVGILVTGAALLGWTVQTIIKYFIRSSEAKTIYIEKLVASNQQNSENFVNTINHQRTLDREMQGKHLVAIQDLTREVGVANSINRELVGFLKKNA